MPQYHKWELSRLRQAMNYQNTARTYGLSETDEPPGMFCLMTGSGAKIQYSVRPWDNGLSNLVTDNYTINSFLSFIIHANNKKLEIAARRLFTRDKIMLSEQNERVKNSKNKTEFIVWFKKAK